MYNFVLFFLSLNAEENYASNPFFFQPQKAGRGRQLDVLLNIKMLSKALIFELCTAVTLWIGIEVSWVVTQGGSS